MKRNREYFIHKRFVAMRFLIAPLCAAALLSTAPLPAMAKDGWSREVEITAHRGNGSEAPENTIPAFQSAIESGADWIELDVTQTEDGVLVVLHDQDLSRVAGNPKKIWELSFEELQKLDVGRRIGPCYANTRIPSLEEVLDYCKDKIRLNIEIKFNEHQTADFIPKLVELIRQKDMTGQCMITSFNYGCLQLVKLFGPEMETGLISSQAIVQPEAYASADHFVLSIELIEPETVDQIHALGKEVVAWTINDQFSLNKCKKAGADNIITDRPAHMAPDRAE